VTINTSHEQSQTTRTTYHDPRISTEEQPSDAAMAAASEVNLARKAQADDRMEVDGDERRQSSSDLEVACAQSPVLGATSCIQDGSRTHLREADRHELGQQPGEPV
jgi:hypothetical protein